jgi:amino acid adenylation domain-containing protein
MDSKSRVMNNLDKRIHSLSPAKRALLELRLRQTAAGPSRVPAIKPRANRDSADLSFAQQRLWFLNQLAPESAQYNVPRALRLAGALDIEALQRSVNELVLRHEPFRTHFQVLDGTVRQIIRESGAVGSRQSAGQILLSLIDLSDLPEAEREAKAKQLAQAEAAQPFDLSRGPLMRARLLRLAEHEHILLLTTHHIVSDAWSAEILFRELGGFYNAFANEQPAPFLPLAIQYADFGEWQREWLQGEELERQLAYWREQLAGVTGVLDLPTDHPRSSVQSSQGDYKFLTLSKEAGSGLLALSRQEGATLFMTLLAAFQILLWRYSGQEDVVVGTPIAGRNHAEIEALIGFFINTLALRSDLSGNPTFKELLTRVRETAIGAYTHQDLPFEKLVEELHPERDLGRNPLFQVMFQFQNTLNPHLDLAGLTVTPLDVSTATAKFDLMLAVREENGELACVIEYSTGLFAGETIARMLDHFATLLAGIVANPDERIASLPLLTEAERQQITFAWTDTRTEFAELQADQSIDQLFERQAARTPNEVAAVFENERITYDELNVRANRLAQHLRRQGAGLEEHVAICVERSVNMIVGLLGILKAGAAYVPLEPTYPRERMFYILEDSQAGLLLTQKSLLASLPQSRATVICLDDIDAELTRESGANFTSGVTADNAAHVIYTSGSTGQPKGVVSSHAASVNRFAWMWRRYPFTAGEVCCQKTSLSFVDSIWEIFGPLLQGVPLVIIPADVVADPPRFVAALSANKVTRLVLVPTLLHAMIDGVDDLARQLQGLQYCVCSGETLAGELAKEFTEKLPQTMLINLYGSSEVAADVTCYEVESTAGGGIPIGRAIANTQVYVLDASFQPAPVNVPGEIFVGGTGLARGYLHRPELTAEKFIPNPFGTGGRLFRTGDLGRYLAGGNIEYRGRRDHQVKVRGFRIELGEVEAALATHPQVDEVVVVTRDDLNGDKRLVAYVVAKGQTGSEPTIADLRAHLRTKLPEYMIPSAFVMMETMPLTPSGKLDRLALPDPGYTGPTDNFVAPRTATEEVLANIWARELGIDRVGGTDDFFALGGHSLLLTRIASRIREAFAIELPLRTLFEASTVGGLAEKIEIARQSAEGLTQLPLIATARDGPLSLSFAQERLWFFDQLEPGSAAYNIPRALRLMGPLNKEALQQSLAAIFARHEVLRSTFRSVDGKPVLSIAADGTPEIPWFDLSQLPPGEREEKTRALVARETEQPFDLAQGPMLRLALVKLAEEEHVLVLTMHHIISDGWSIGILLGELVWHYNGLVTERAAGNRSLPPELSVQYADFASWQRKYLSGPGLAEQLEFWRAQLDGAPVLMNLPLDRPRRATRSFRGARRSLTISKETVDRLKRIARSEHATLFMTLLTTFQLLLSCLTGDEDIVVGSPTAGRNRPEIENLIGYFVNTLVLRTKLAGDPSFRGVLQRTRETALGAYGHQDMPFEKLVDELRPQRSLEFNPLFQVWFVLQNATDTFARQEWVGLNVQPINIDSATTRHDLQLTLWETEAGLEGAFTYSTDLFDAETLDGIGEQFANLLQIVVEDPDIRLSVVRADLDQVGDAQRQRAAKLLEEASHDKLRSSKRKVVSDRV